MRSDKVMAVDFQFIHRTRTYTSAHNPLSNTWYVFAARGQRLLTILDFALSAAKYNNQLEDNCNGQSRVSARFVLSGG